VHLAKNEDAIDEVSVRSPQRAGRRSRPRGPSPEAPVYRRACAGSLEIS
jgi:hypothetical protein